ncbi:MAG: hypothetical protein M1838_000501 [Thelocarpon superellum]|nr:MAG: hypothetical protein M1838_000501 [Thelocarpon superellum]
MSTKHASTFRRIEWFLATYSLWATGVTGREVDAAYHVTRKLDYHYPYTHDQILFASYRDNGSRVEQWNLTDSLSLHILSENEKPPTVWDPNDPTVVRYLQPPNNQTGVTRLSYAVDPATTINAFAQADGVATWLDSQDPFWPPACGRMSFELAQLQSPEWQPRNGSKTMGVTLKHFGFALPGDGTDIAYVDSYISVTVLSSGPSMLSLFDGNCQTLFASLTNSTSAISWSSGELPLAQTVEDGTESHINTTGVSESNVTGQLPQQYQGTTGGQLATRFKDGSEVLLQVKPFKVSLSD